MLIESTKLLFALNIEHCPDQAFGLVKKNFLEIFNNKSDWTFAIKCQTLDCHKNLIGLICLEGVEFGLYLSADSKIIFHCVEKNNVNDKPYSQYNVCPLPIIKERAYQTNSISLTYSYKQNLYNIYYNSELVYQKQLEERIEFSTKQIKLCSIARQFITYDESCHKDKLELKNLVIASKVLSQQEIEKYLEPETHMMIERDHYDRSMLKSEHRSEILCYYSFEDNLYGKVWDLSGNNNFLFTSLDLKERVGNSAI